MISLTAKDNAIEVDTLWLLIMSHVYGPDEPKSRRQMPIACRNLVLWNSKFSTFYRQKFLCGLHFIFNRHNQKCQSVSLEAAQTYIQNKDNV